MTRRLPVALLTAAVLPLATFATAGVATASGPGHRTVDAMDSNEHFTNNELSVAASPANPSDLVIGYNDYNQNEGCGTTYSTDGGRSWAAHSFIPGITATDNNGNPYSYTSSDGDTYTQGIYQFAGDPAVAFSAKTGHAIFACYGYVFAAGNGAKNVALFASRSVDGGATWRHPIQVSSCDCNGNGVGGTKGHNGQFPDHDAIAVNNWAGTPDFGRVAIAQAQFHGQTTSDIQAYVSDDDGQTWSAPIVINVSNQRSSQDAIPFFGPDGSLYVTFDNQTGPSVEQQQVLVAKLAPSATAFTAPVKVVDWINPDESTLPNSDYRSASYGVGGADQNGRLTFVFNDDRGNGHQNVYVTHASASNLSSWSTPAAIEPATAEQFFPWLSVAPSGRADVVFYDRSADPANVLNHVTYAELNPTGATTDSVSRTDLTPASRNGLTGTLNGNLNGGQTTTSCTPFIGDYIGITTVGSTVYAAWTGNGPSWHTDEFGNPVTCDVNEDSWVAAITP